MMETMIFEYGPEGRLNEDQLSSAEYACLNHLKHFYSPGDAASTKILKVNPWNLEIVVIEEGERKGKFFTPKISEEFWEIFKTCKYRLVKVKRIYESALIPWAKKKQAVESIFRQGVFVFSRDDVRIEVHCNPKRDRVTLEMKLGEKTDLVKDYKYFIIFISTVQIIEQAIAVTQKLRKMMDAVKTLPCYSGDSADENDEDGQAWGRVNRKYKEALISIGASLTNDKDPAER